MFLQLNVKMQPFSIATNHIMLVIVGLYDNLNVMQLSYTLSSLQNPAPAYA